MGKTEIIDMALQLNASERYAVAEKIMQRDASCIVSDATTRLETEEDDPYADYKVPDDLMW